MADLATGVPVHQRPAIKEPRCPLCSQCPYLVLPAAGWPRTDRDQVCVEASVELVTPIDAGRDLSAAGARLREGRPGGPAPRLPPGFSALTAEGDFRFTEGAGGRIGQRWEATRAPARPPQGRGLLPD
jgi:hypothetical protein